MARCIWCKSVGTPAALEHIIPEALGCPEGFVLSGGTVCRACNNGLSHLDQAVIHELDILTYMAGVPRKKGRAPEIRGRGNIIGTREPDGYTISINMERYPVKAHDGSRLGAFGKSDRNIGATLERDGQFAKIAFSTTIGQNPKFVRGILKIALSSLTYFLGEEAALSEDFDPVRTFVQHGAGGRPIFLMPSTSGGYVNQVWPPYQSGSGEYAITFRLAVIEFCVDLSPKLALFSVLKTKAFEAYGSSGWTYLPVDFESSG